MQHKDLVVASFTYCNKQVDAITSHCRQTYFSLSITLALQPTMAFKGPMPPNILKGSNIDEGVTNNDLHLLFSVSGCVEWIKLQISTCALTTRKNDCYNGKNCCNNYKVVAIRFYCNEEKVVASCCNKLRGNRFMQQAG